MFVFIKIYFCKRISTNLYFLILKKRTLKIITFDNYYNSIIVRNVQCQQENHQNQREKFSLATLFAGCRFEEIAKQHQLSILQRRAIPLSRPNEFFPKHNKKAENK